MQDNSIFQSRYSSALSIPYLSMIFLSLFLLLLHSSSVFAKPTVESSYQFYQISPKSLADISSEIEKKTPIKHAGNKYHASTSWQIKWAYQWQKKSGICYISSSNTTLIVSYIMPEISVNNEKNIQVSSSFSGYYHALLKHEAGHYQSGIKAADAVEDKLLNFSSYSSCEELELAANKEITTIINEHKKLDTAYDIATDHGRTQGVSIRKYL